MSTKEQIYQYIESMSDEQLKGLLIMLTGYASVVDEQQDDAYCAELYEEARGEADTDATSIEDFARELGISLA